MYRHNDGHKNVPVDTEMYRQTDVQMKRQMDRHTTIHITGQEAKNLRLHLTHAWRSFAYLRLAFLHLKELECVREPLGRTQIPQLSVRY